MSSDTYSITVLSKANDHIVLRVRTGFAGGPNDTAYTRSFALTILTRSREGWNNQAKPKLLVRNGEPFRKATKTTALEKESNEWPGNWYVSQQFFQENVDKYIVATKVIARYNQGNSDYFSEKQNATYDKLVDKNLPLADFEEAVCKNLHFIELDVQVTDAKWLNGIEVGWIFGSTAYDVWWKDPTRPTPPKSKKFALKKESAKDPEKKESEKKDPEKKESVKKTPNPKKVLAPGARIHTNYFGHGGVRAVMKDKATATIPPSYAKFYKTSEYALITTDDGIEFWENLANIKLFTKNDVYEEGHSDPEAFWARIMKLPMIERAQEIGQAIGTSGDPRFDESGEIFYSLRTRRCAGFLSSLSIERAAQLIGEAFAYSQRPKKFAEWHPFEKSSREFDRYDWRPFQGETKVTFHPTEVIQCLVGGLGWRIGNASAASGKGPAAIVSREFLDALTDIPELDPWRKFLAQKKPARADFDSLKPGLYGLPGKVADGGGH